MKLEKLVFDYHTYIESSFIDAREPFVQSLELNAIYAFLYGFNKFFTKLLGTGIQSSASRWPV